MAEIHSPAVSNCAIKEILTNKHSILIHADLNHTTITRLASYVWYFISHIIQFATVSVQTLIRC